VGQYGAISREKRWVKFMTKGEGGEKKKREQELKKNTTLSNNPKLREAKNIVKWEKEKISQEQQMGRWNCV